VGVGPQWKETQLADLLGGRGADVASTVAEHVGEQTGESVEVLGAVGVVNSRALAAHHDRYLVGLGVGTHS
jgi:hypothetical protein